MPKTLRIPKYESWPRQKIKIIDLFLDSRNVRLDLSDELSQDALISDLFSNEDAMQVLTSIATNGFFPDEVPVVVKENNKVVVLEGNRRVAALKALLRPEIIPSKESAIKHILKRSVSIPKDLEIVMAPDRNSAMIFLATKHTQNTRRRWRPLRQAYFYKAQLDTGKTVQSLRDDYPTVDIGKFLRYINIHKIAKSITYDTKHIAKKVFNERTFPISTLERLYDDKQFRDFFGFEFDGNGEVQIKTDKDEFEKRFKQVVQDLVEKIEDSRTLNDDGAKKRYLNRLSQYGLTKATPSTSKITTSKDFKEKVIIPTKEIRKKLAPSDIKFSLQSPGVKRMLIELQTIDYHEFPIAAHDLLRSFLECALKEYFSHYGKTITHNGPYVYLDNVLSEFKAEMDSKKIPELSQVTLKIMNKKSMQPYTALALNATNHNPSIFTTEKEVIEAWDTMEKLLRYILDPK